jgi:hypothetical protein
MDSLPPQSNWFSPIIRPILCFVIPIVYAFGVLPLVSDIPELRIPVAVAGILTGFVQWWLLSRTNAEPSLLGLMVSMSGPFLGAASVQMLPYAMVIIGGAAMNISFGIGFVLVGLILGGILLFGLLPWIFQWSVAPRLEPELVPWVSMSLLMWVLGGAPIFVLALFIVLLRLA